MSKKIIMKVENKGRIQWKIDSFWSLSLDRSHAKTHTQESIERLIKNYLSVINSYLEHNDDEEVHYYDNMKIGYDFVEELNICEFDFIKDGPFEYKLKYDENIKKVVAVDIRRKMKLDQIKKSLEENI